MTLLLLSDVSTIIHYFDNECWREERRREGEGVNELIKLHSSYNIILLSYYVIHL